MTIPGPNVSHPPRIAGCDRRLLSDTHVGRFLDPPAYTSTECSARASPSASYVCSREGGCGREKHASSMSDVREHPMYTRALECSTTELNLEGESMCLAASCAAGLRACFSVRLPCFRSVVCVRGLEGGGRRVDADPLRVYCCCLDVRLGCARQPHRPCGIRTSCFRAARLCRGLSRSASFCSSLPSRACDGYLFTVVRAQCAC